MPFERELSIALEAAREAGAILRHHYEHGTKTWEKSEDNPVTLADLEADKAIADFTVNTDNINRALARNPILVTALNPVIGYEKGAEVAKKAYKEGRPVKDVAREMTDLTDEELDRLLDPAALTEGGIKH